MKGLILVTTVVLLVTACSDSGTSLGDTGTSPTPYPIHAYFVGDVPPDIRRGAEEAAAEWGRILTPTRRAPFTVTVERACGPVSFSIGQRLKPGLHLYVETAPAGVGWSAAASTCVFSSHGESSVPMNPVGKIYVNHDADWSPHWDKLFLHEIGHVLGIGSSSDRWRNSIRRDGSYRWLVDPQAIAVFDKMGGSEFPVNTPKIPLYDDSHWDACTGVNDIMVPFNFAQNEVTELTMASLAVGYAYDTSFIPPPRGGLKSQTDEHGNTRRYGPTDFRKLEQSTWNWGRCKDGRTDRSVSSQRASTSNLDTSDWVIYEHDWR